MFIQEKLAKVNIGKGKDSINQLDLSLILRQYFSQVLLIVEGY
jgi:hypothetical protein